VGDWGERCFPGTNFCPSALAQRLGGRKGLGVAWEKTVWVTIGRETIQRATEGEEDIKQVCVHKQENNHANISKEDHCEDKQGGGDMGVPSASSSPRIGRGLSRLTTTQFGGGIGSWKARRISNLPRRKGRWGRGGTAAPITRNRYTK